MFVYLLNNCLKHKTVYLYIRYQAKSQVKQEMLIYKSNNAISQQKHEVQHPIANQDDPHLDPILLNTLPERVAEIPVNIHLLFSIKIPINYRISWRINNQTINYELIVYVLNIWLKHKTCSGKLGDITSVYIFKDYSELVSGTYKRRKWLTFSCSRWSFVLLRRNTFTLKLKVISIYLDLIS